MYYEGRNLNRYGYITLYGIYQLLQSRLQGRDFLKHYFIPLAIAACILGVSAHAQNASEEVIDAGRDRLKQNQSAQENVNKLHEQATDLVEEYQALLKVVDGLKIYNKILGKQLANQQAEMSTIESSIAGAAVIERQILPLLTNMLDALENFIRLDVPFLRQERLERVVKLRRLIENSALSNAEKTRRVFEAFQIENDFGNTIETYKGKLQLDKGTFDVDYLRIGRVAFVYRTVGGDAYGYWHSAEKQWQPIDQSLYQRNIDKGIKMARQELAPELITVPVVNMKESL